MQLGFQVEEEDEKDKDREKDTLRAAVFCFIGIVLCFFAMLETFDGKQSRKKSHASAINGYKATAWVSLYH